MQEKKFNLCLWKNLNIFKEFTSGTPLVILGANGSGKTRLSFELERLNEGYKSGELDLTREKYFIHRITAQKSITIPDEISLKGLEISEKELYMGSAKSSNKHISKYNNKPSTHILNDFGAVLRYLFVKSNYELELAHRNKEDKELVTLTETVENIWNSLLPKRTIDLIGNEVHAISGEDRYSGTDMSDGERVILYIIAQVVTLKENSILIIDEPELHIHKAILKKLWDTLERERKDCLFIYVTHDLDFAVSRNSQETIWVKSYEGKNTWETEFININEYENLPQSLVYELIGTQKNIIFVEGTRDSLDYHLYQEMYLKDDFHVIPCGGCTEVINFVKAKKGYTVFDSISVYGIIDRDFRTDAEIQALEKDNIFCVSVAEVENLFIVPELLDVMEHLLGCEPNTANKAKESIINRFNSKREEQIKLSFIRELNWKLSNEDIENKALAGNTLDNEQIVKKLHKEFTDTINENYIGEILNEKASIFKNYTEIKDILKVFNYKDMLGEINSIYKLRKDDPYSTKVLRFLKNDENAREKIINSIKPYLPDLPTGNP